MIYLIIIILLFLLSFRYDINKASKYRDQWYHVILVIFILLAGLRWRIGMDTPMYLSHFYHDYPTIEEFSFEDYGVGASPLFVIMNSLIKTIGLRFYVVQIIHALFVNVLIFNYIKKHSDYIFTCVTFYFITFYATYNTEIMRASMSISICLYANDYILEKKWFKGYFLYALALLFHIQSIVMFVMPLLFFLRFNLLGLFFVVGAFFVGYFIQESLGDYIDLFEFSEDAGAKVAKYAQSEKFGAQEKTKFYFVIAFLLRYFYAYISLLMIKKRDANHYLLKYERFLMIGLLFYMMRISVEIMYRFMEYYYLYFVFFYADLFVETITKKRKVNYSRALSYAKSFMIFLPFFLSEVRGYFINDGRIRPYSSIFEKSISKEREAAMMELDRPIANKNEY